MLQKLHQIAKRKGGICLSDCFFALKDKFLWQCSRGHQWLATADSVLYSESWCPQCAGNQKLTLDGLKELAEEKGGKCQATEYKNSKIKMPWMCRYGHLWYATAFSIKVRKSWCPVCYKNKKRYKIGRPALTPILLSQ